MPTLRGAQAASTLAALLVAGAACLSPAGAYAEVPSVDAYGGQALVLGKPRPPGERGGSRQTSAGSRSTGSRSAGAGASSSGESGYGSSHSRGSHSHPAGSPTAPAASTGTGKSAAARTDHRGGAQSGAENNRATGRSETGTEAAARGGGGAGAAATAAALARESQPVGLSGSDLALLIAIALGLVASGALVRVLSHRPG
jgi:hypothetical protein